MRELEFSIGQVAGSTGEAVVDVDPALDVFEGHFPGNPILPGVVQIDLIIAAAARMFQSRPETAFLGLSAIKFKAMVRPGDSLRLLLECTPPGVSFAVKRGSDICTMGHLLYGARA